MNNFFLKLRKVPHLGKKIRILEKRSNFDNKFPTIFVMQLHKFTFLFEMLLQCIPTLTVDIKDDTINPSMSEMLLSTLPRQR